MTRPPSVPVRRIAAHEHALYRELRLRALADAPDSFGETLEHARARSPEKWSAHVEALATSGALAGFVAEADGEPCGMVAGREDPQRPGSVRVGDTWVDPRFRGRGVGRALMEALLTWARETGRDHVGLWAPAHEAAALALYRRVGFREHGTPREHRPGMRIVAMELLLPRAGVPAG